jgi:hypothetical protein
MKTFKSCKFCGYFDEDNTNDHNTNDHLCSKCTQLLLQFSFSKNKIENQAKQDRLKKLYNDCQDPQKKSVLKMFMEDSNNGKQKRPNSKPGRHFAGKRSPKLVRNFERGVR